MRQQVLENWTYYYYYCAASNSISFTYIIFNIYHFKYIQTMSLFMVTETHGELFLRLIVCGRILFWIQHQSYDKWIYEIIKWHTHQDHFSQICWSPDKIVTTNGVRVSHGPQSLATNTLPLLANHVDYSTLCHFEY